MKINFPNEESGTKLSGLYTEIGALGMREAANFESTDIFSLFIGAIVDCSCGNVIDAPLTTVFSEYCYHFQNIYIRGQNTRCTKTDLQNRYKNTKKIKDNYKSVFRDYQVSAKGASWRKCLEHLVESLRSVGRVAYLYVSHYESAHKIFEQAHQQMSRRSAMEKTLKVLEFQSSVGTKLTSSKLKYGTNLNKFISISEETTCPINSGENE